MHYLHTFLMGTNVFNQWFACIMKLASLLNHISIGGRICRGRIWSPNIWGPSLLGADFVRGRVCQGPTLLGAEMSRNRKGNSRKILVNRTATANIDRVVLYLQPQGRKYFTPFVSMIITHTDKCLGSVDLAFLYAWSHTDIRKIAVEHMENIWKITY